MRCLGNRAAVWITANPGNITFQDRGAINKHIDNSQRAEVKWGEGDIFMTLHSQILIHLLIYDSKKIWLLTEIWGKFNNLREERIYNAAGNEH